MIKTGRRVRGIEAGANPFPVVRPVANGPAALIRAAERDGWMAWHRSPQAACGGDLSTDDELGGCRGCGILQDSGIPRPRPLPPQLNVHGFAVADAYAAGVSRRRLRAADLRAPFHGVRAGRIPDDTRALAQAYAAGLRHSDAFSHGTALELVGVAVPPRSTSDLHVTSMGGAQRARGRGVRGHEAATGSVRLGLVAGLPTVHPVDAWCQLGSSLTTRELVAVGDALVRRVDPIATLDELAVAVRRWAPRRGVRSLREALPLVRERTDSRQETELRLDAAEAGLPEPEVNGIIVDDDGRFVAYGDLVYREYRTVLEYDGEQHRVDDVQFARDVGRLDDLARLGWRVIRVTKQHRGPGRGGRLARLREALMDRGWRPDASS